MSETNEMTAEIPSLGGTLPMTLFKPGSLPPLKTPTGLSGLDEPAWGANPADELLRARGAAVAIQGQHGNDDQSNR